MPTAVLVILALCILFIFFSGNALTGIVLAGLLAWLYTLVPKIDALNKRVNELEAKFFEKAAESEPDSVLEVSTASEQSNATELAHEASVVADEPQIELTRPVTESLYIQDVAAEQVIELAATADDDQKAPIEEPAIPPAPPYATPAPSAPSFIEKLGKYAWDWFTGGNMFVRVGIIILFMGMTFLVRYAIGQNLIPIELRLAAVSAAAIGLLFWGWRQRNTRPDFALVIQGGGIGLLYLTIFAGFSLYDVIPSMLAFVFLALTVMLGAMLAILQNAKPLALFAAIGGFLAPILTSSGSNNYIGLFSYYTLLNLGIFSIAWFKSWRILNFVGFVFTFAISTVWGVLSYEPAFFASTEPFLIIFFLLYVAIGILFAHKRIAFYKDYVDSSLIFGTPLLAFGLQCAMVKNYPYGIAISAACLAAFYLVLTSVLWRKYGKRLRLLSETFLSLGVIFLTLAIPFAIDGSLTSAVWAIEGAGILWVSIKQLQKYRRLFGIALVFSAGVMLVADIIFPLRDSLPVFSQAFSNSLFIGCVIVAIAASISSWLLSREFSGKLPIEKTLSYGLLFYALLTLLGGFEYQIACFELYALHGILLVVLSAVCIIAYTIAGTKLQWQRAHWVSTAFIVPLAIAAALCYAYQPQLAAYYGYIIWPLALCIYFYGLKQGAGVITGVAEKAAHITVTTIIICLLFWEGLWQLLLCYSLLAILFDRLSRKLAWPSLKIPILSFLPVLVICTIGAIVIDDNLISLSSIASDMVWPFPPGYVLWPFAFVVYFYLLRQNQTIAGHSTANLHYSGAALIATLLLWLGLWPLLLGATLLSILCCYLWQRLSWAEMRITSMALLPIMILIFCIKLFDNNFDPFDLQGFNMHFLSSIELGYILWPLGLGAMFWTYWQYDRKQHAAPNLLHSLGILLTVGLVTWEVSWHVLDIVGFMNAWHLAWLPVMSILVIALLIKAPCWPFNRDANSYHWHVSLPLGLALIAWSLLQLASSGSSAPLPWLPLINPVDIVQAVIIIGCFWAASPILSTLKTLPSKQVINITLLAFIFLWANVDLLRAVHHWADIAWQIPTIISANISQTVLSLFWALCGLLTTLYASRKQQRFLWIAGAVLLAVVVLKLFLIDFSAQETVERIVSFTGVGLLLMLVGYFSPLPPKIRLVEESCDEQVVKEV
ncbi:MAG: hypothetical protein COC09_09425 [Gammaproteobacteria bacterium]|nr:DUF2339 domain-containing protein [Gammaproteobacteria bacterium]PCH62192.1 MAG: hypothetical protein COC09_09425 [Gammaproteobacteria bacterium]